MRRRTVSVRVSTTAKVVRLRGKRLRGLIRISFRPSADRPLGDPSYATAGIENEPRRRRSRTGPP